MVGKTLVDHLDRGPRLAAVDVRRQHRDPERAALVDDQPPGIHAGVVGQQPGEELREEVRLEPGAAIGRHGERRRVRLAEPERGEGRDLLPHRLGIIASEPALDRLGHRPDVDLLGPVLVRQLPPQQVRVGQVAPGQRRQGPHHLLVVDDHPVGLTQHRLERRMGVDGLLVAMPSLDERRDHVGLHRTGTEQRDLGDEVAELVGLEPAEQLLLSR